MWQPLHLPSTHVSPWEQDPGPPATHSPVPLKNRFWGVLFLSQMRESYFLFVSEMSNYFTAPVPRSTSALCLEDGRSFSITEQPKESSTEQQVLSVFGVDLNERGLVCSPNPELCSAGLNVSPFPPKPAAKKPAKPETRLGWVPGSLAPLGSHTWGGTAVALQARVTIAPWISAMTETSLPPCTSCILQEPAPLLPSLHLLHASSKPRARHQAKAGGTPQGRVTEPLSWRELTRPYRACSALQKPVRGGGHTTQLPPMRGVALGSR